MRVLISGGCKQGKSTLAEKMAAAQGRPLVYVATMVPRDDEDHARVARHRAERAGYGFETYEAGTDITALIGRVDPESSLLVDSTTALLAEEMFGADGTFDASAADRVCADLLKVAAAFEKIVFVSDGIYSDAARYDDMTEAYRKGLAAVDRALAGACDTVLEVVAGIPIAHKGRVWL